MDCSGHTQPLAFLFSRCGSHVWPTAHALVYLYFIKITHAAYFHFNKTRSPGSTTTRNVICSDELMIHFNYNKKRDFLTCSTSTTTKKRDLLTGMDGEGIWCKWHVISLSYLLWISHLRVHSMWKGHSSEILNFSHNSLHNFKKKKLV